LRRAGLPSALLCLAAAALGAAPNDQTAAPDQTSVKEEVVVTAERGPEPREEIPAAVSVLTRQEIERLPAENLSELLEHLPGFQVLSPEEFGGPAIVSSRGFFGGGEAEYVQLLIDGVPVADAESALADWRRIRASDIERVEALRGPASSFYGDALGGVIQVFTRSAGTEPAARVSLSGGSFGTGGADALVRRSLGRLDLGISAGASFSDGFREHSATDQQSLDVALGRRSGPDRWMLTLSGSSREREDPGPRTLEQLRSDRFGSDPLFRLDREENDRGRIALSYGHETPALRYTALLYGTRREAEATRTLLIVAGVGDRARRGLQSWSLGGTLQGERPVRLLQRESEIRAGLDFAREGLDADYRPVSDDGEQGPRSGSESGRRDRIALFLSHGWKISSRLRLTTGLRWDRIADDFGGGDRERDREAWSPRAGINWRLGELDGSPLVLFAQVSRAFKAPTLDQLFDPRPFPDFAGGSFTISNPDLEPQEADSIEIGASRSMPAASFEAVAYRTQVRDEIDFDPATFRYRNIGRTRHVGVEASARFLEAGVLSPSLEYQWTRVEPLDGENRGTQLKNIPEHLVRAGIRASPTPPFQALLHYTWMGGRFLDDANRIELGESSVLDLRLQYAFDPVRLRLDLLNLTDEDYEQLGFALPDFSGGETAYYLPAAGFAARAGLDWQF
jgi:vitamin B12 transporter